MTDFQCVTLTIYALFIGQTTPTHVRDNGKNVWTIECRAVTAQLPVQALRNEAAGKRCKVKNRRLVMLVLFWPLLCAEVGCKCGTTGEQKMTPAVPVAYLLIPLGIFAGLLMPERHVQLFRIQRQVPAYAWEVLSALLVLGAEICSCCLGCSVQRTPRHALLYQE